LTTLPSLWLSAAASAFLLLQLKPRRKAGGSQWWGQSQLFGEMFSSDEDAINQSRAKKCVAALPPSLS
jgi:hypothetical protein